MSQAVKQEKNSNTFPSFDYLTIALTIDLTRHQDPWLSAPRSPGVWLFRYGWLFFLTFRI